MIDHTLQALVAYLPFFTIPDGKIGPIPLHPFGVLVATGIMVGHRIATKRAAQLGLSAEKFESLVFATVATGIVLSHVLDAIFYHPQQVMEDPLYLIKIWAGLSSFGGFFGAAVGFLVYLRRNPDVDGWKAADAIGLGLPVGWIFGRMGCATVHDHPGRPSTHWLAVDFPVNSPRPLGFPPGPRFDLGLLELMLTPILVAVVYIVAKKTTKRGAVIGALCTVYPFLRFPLDFLRETDANGGDIRYFGFLTPGHFASIGCLAIGLYCLNHARNDTKPAYVPKPEAAETDAKDSSDEAEPSKKNDKKSDKKSEAKSETHSAQQD
ncbi:MAG: prolipoprotein diacylglyceryl transferase [Myxococcales bacterium]|nr:prolipoprotein diacylglyceryl transferase [Myxococcales bacterium]